MPRNCCEQRSFRTLSGNPVISFPQTKCGAIGVKSVEDGKMLPNPGWPIEISNLPQCIQHPMEGELESLVKQSSLILYRYVTQFHIVLTYCIFHIKRHSKRHENRKQRSKNSNSCVSNPNCQWHEIVTTGHTQLYKQRDIQYILWLNCFNIFFILFHFFF